MAHEVKTGLWATNDGSYGVGTVVTVNTEAWNEKQVAWYNALADKGEVYGFQLIQIDNGEQPE